jgi:hypothetical protein
MRHQHCHMTEAALWRGFAGGAGLREHHDSPTLTEMQQLQPSVALMLFTLADAGHAGCCAELDEEQAAQVVGAMFERQVEPGETIIRWV